MLIGVDHGNKQIKTVHGEPFVSGLQQSLTRPFGQSLQYCGTYYTLSNERIPFHKDKTEDDRFFVLTLIAIAEEITARGIGEKEQQHIQLAVGLPPAHFGSQAEKFTAYFQGRGLVAFMLYNKIRSRGNAELDLLLDEGDVDAILMGRRTQYPAEAIQLVERLAQEFVNDLFSTLRERMLDLRYCKVVFVGGGAILLRRQIEDSGKVGTPLFVTNINANAAGFEYLYRLETVGR